MLSAIKMKPLPVSKFISYINASVNSPDNNKQVTILYGLEMTKPVHVRILCLTIFWFSGQTQTQIDFSSYDRKL